MACYHHVVAWVLEDHLLSGVAGRDPRIRALPIRTTTTTTEQAKIMETLVAMTMAMDKHLSVGAPTRTRMQHLQT